MTSATAKEGVFRNPLEVFTSGWTHRKLIYRLAKREIEFRYRGALLGLLWSLIVPLMMLAVYAFVFTVVFSAKFDVPIDSKWAFAVVLFSGLTVFNIFAEVVQRAPGLVLENISYVKKVVFPLETLAWVVMAVALFNAAVSAAAVLLAYILILGMPPLTTVLWPLVILPLILASMGLCWLFASLGVYIRDIKQFIPVIVTVLMFTSPVLFSLDTLTQKLPENIAQLVRSMPLAIVLEQTRGVLFRAEAPDWMSLGILTLAGWFIAWLGYMWFCKTCKGFADVI